MDGYSEWFFKPKMACYRDECFSVFLNHISHPESNTWHLFGQSQTRVAAYLGNGTFRLPFQLPPVPGSYLTIQAHSAFHGCPYKLAAFVMRTNQLTPYTSQSE